MDSCFKNSLGVIQQVDEKQQTAYQSIVNMLKPERSLSSQQYTQSTILKDLDNFHNYYNQKCQQYKENYDRINQQNWDYASKIIKYQKALENYQLMYFQAKEQIIFTQSRTKQMQQQYQRQISELACIIREKDMQINHLKNQLSKNSQKIQAPKRKIIKLKQKSIRVQQQDTNNIQSARSHRQVSSLRNQLQQYVAETQSLINQNDILRKKVKHLQADRRYEQQRLKNATLSLELDLKIKKQQISRLNHQIQIYEKKFEQLILAYKSNNSSLSKEKQILCSNSIERNPLSPKYHENWRNIEISQNLTDEKQTQKTQRKLDIQTQRTKKKTHKRHGSSNLQQNQLKNQKQEEFNMKIKIFRFKNKKYT